MGAGLATEQKTAESLYKGFFINLDDSHRRRAESEAEIAKYGLGSTYSRFPAANGNSLNFPNPQNLLPGAMGCFISHYQVMKENLGSNHHIHVMEDEVIFATCTQQTINWAIQSGYLDQYDILFTDLTVPLRNEIYKLYKSTYDKLVERDAKGNITKATFSVIDMKGHTYASASSYLVSKRSIKKVHDLLEAELKQGARVPVDILLRQKNYEGALQVGCIFPFVTSVRLENSFLSTIDKRDNRAPELAVDIARRAFFIGADLNACQHYLAQYAPLPAQNDKLAAILGHLLTYSLTDEYRFF